MRKEQYNDYRNLEVRRPMGRRVEEMLRAEAARCHKGKTLKNLIKTGFKIRRTHVARKYLDNSSQIMQHACDIYLARFISQPQDFQNGLTRNEIIKKGVKSFENLEPEAMSYYLAAALVDDPRKSTPIASNAYHNFLLLHVENHQRNSQENSNEWADLVIRKGRQLWNKMKPHQKFPFFLLAYMNSYYPREIDGSVMETINSLPKRNLTASLRAARKELNEIDAAYSGVPANFSNLKKRKLEPNDPLYKYIS